MVFRRKKKYHYITSPSGRRVKFRRRHSKKIPILPIVGVLAAPAVQESIASVTQGHPEWIINNLQGFVGMDNGQPFSMDTLVRNYTPVALGIIAHIVLNKVGVNRMFNNIPVVGKYISL